MEAARWAEAVDSAGQARKKVCVAGVPVVAVETATPVKVTMRVCKRDVRSLGKFQIVCLPCRNYGGNGHC